jgi:hypothetical protein
MVRQVRLTTRDAILYPTLDPDVWYTAAVVKGIAILRHGPHFEIRARVLPPEHFTFRGGSDHHGTWGDMRARRVDRQFPADRTCHSRGLLQAI